MRISTHIVGELFTNSFVLTDEGTGITAVIDPGEFSDELREQLESIGRDKIKYILLTHCHFDHILGVCELAEFTGAQVVIHKDDAAALSDPNRNGLTLFGMPDARLPSADITVIDGDTLQIGDLTVRVLHTPGHSQGSCCYICEDVIFSGDTLFAGSCGRTDLPTGSFMQIIKSLGRLAALKGDYRVYPGHGSNTMLSVERAENQYMK